MTTVVTVGRNVGDSLDSRPMDNAAWQSFCEEVWVAVRYTVGEPFFTGLGEGNSEQWGREDAYTVVAPEPFGSVDRDKLLVELARVGRYYGQEAVAVTFGRTEFV